MKVLVLGLGNPILSDDGVGLHIARALKEEMTDVDVVAADTIGLNLLDLIQGYDRMFVIDALITRGSGFGVLRMLPTGEGGCHFFSSHGLDFFQTMAFGKLLGLKIPVLASVYGIGIGDAIRFGAELSPELRQGLDAIRREILEDIAAKLRQPVPPPSLQASVD